MGGDGCPAQRQDRRGNRRRTGYDAWFLIKLRNIIEMEKRLLAEPLTPELLWQAKRYGFSDSQIGTLADRLTEQVRQLRHEWGMRPVYKMVDTCAAEFDAATPYFYSSYEKETRQSQNITIKQSLSAVALSVSDRASSSTIAACTQHGRCKKPVIKASC
jgi:hypothetical protein